MPGKNIAQLGLSILEPCMQFNAMILVVVVEVDLHIIVGCPQPGEAVLFITFHGDSPALILPQQQLHEVDEELDLDAPALPVLFLT